MGKTVWKTVLNVADIQDIEVPIGSIFLTAREQREELCVWYRCDPFAPKVSIRIAIIGTGHSAPDDGLYIGTGQLHGGSLVFHVFADRNP